MHAEINHKRFVKYHVIYYLIIMKKEYDLLLLFGGKISKNPTGSGTDSTDFIVSSDEVENISDTTKAVFYHKLWSFFPS